MLSDYIRRLVGTFPKIRQVWLLGSRANGTAKDNSDWDYIVFGDTALLETLRSNPNWKEPEIDLMVVHNGDDFEEPWGERPKHGSLSGWEWEQVSPTCAQYKATKPKNDLFRAEVSRQKAVRVWPRDG